MAKLRLLKTGHGDLTLAEWDQNRPETVAGARRFSPNISRPGGWHSDSTDRDRPARSASSMSPRRRF